MRVRRTMAKSLATLVAVLLLSASVAPAFAADDDVPSSAPIVTAAVTIGSAHLQGKTAAEARVAVLAAADEATFAPVPAVVNGRTFVLDPKLAMTVDVDRLVAAALDATDTLALTPFSVSPSAVATFVAGMATATDRKAVNASRFVYHRRLRLTASAVGLKLDRAAAAAALTAALD
jgi:hypothetical protein